MPEQDWIPESKCPIIPASGYYAAEVLNKPKMGLILQPGRGGRNIAPGGVGLMRICAAPPKEDQIEGEGYKTSGIYGPGDIIYAQVSIDMNSETVEWYDPEENVNRTFYLISEGRILGRCRYPKIVEAAQEEEETPDVPAPN